MIKPTVFGRARNAAVAFANRHVFPQLEAATAPSYDTAFRCPPVFVIGPPRSGSTVIIQTITEAFDVAYFSNRHCRFFGAPALAERIFRPTNDRPPSEFQSEHGWAKGRYAPSECGEWWYRFFRRTPAYTPLREADEWKMRRFRRSLLAMTSATSKPLVLKNLYASLRLEPMARHVREALYVIVRRGERANAHSILEGRKKALGRYDQWWSVPPPNVDDLISLDPAGQVVGQIRAINRLIELSMANGTIQPERCLVLDYESFCADVHGALNQLEAFFLSNGIRVMRRAEVPAQFPMRSGVRIDHKLYDRLVELTTLTERHGCDR